MSQDQQPRFVPNEGAESAIPRTEQLETQRHIWNLAMKPRNIAHRGFSAVAPENTLVAYRKAAQAGFWGAETDIQLTKDGHWICIHDDTVDRTTNGTGRVDQMTLEEIKKLDAGSWRGPQFAGERVPTFEEYLLACYAGGLVPYIEIKGGYPAEDLERAVSAVYRLGMEWQSVFISFSLDALRLVRNMSSELVLGLLRTGFSEEALQDVMSLGNAFLDMGGIPTEENMELARQLGVAIEVWTINDVAAAWTALSRGVTGITTDAIANLKSLL
ncbi:MAG: glycerophosphodiester phosphodiesterase family protein [Bacillota bacterium]